MVNEFGEIGLDHALIAASNDQIVVLENGCMCCTVRGDLLATLQELHAARATGAMQPFDRLVIETSGLADPAPILQALLSEPALERHYHLAQTIATFDAVNGAATLARHEESVRQIAVADRILITKLDLCTAGPLADTLADTEAAHRATLRGLNDAACIARVPCGDQEAAELLRSAGADPAHGPAQALAWLDLPAYSRPAPHDAHAHGLAPAGHLQEVASYCFIKQEPLAREALRLLLSSLESNLGANLLRVKGLVNVAEVPGRPAVIQGAQHLLHNLSWLDAWPDDDHRTRIVFIAQGIARASVQEMIELLERVASRTARARQRAAAPAPAPTPAPAGTMLGR